MSTRGTGDILDVLQLCKNRYPGNLEMQGEYLNAAITIIKRDYSDGIRTMNFDWNNYNVSVTGFPSGGKVYFFWELVLYGITYACGLEEMETSTRQSSLLFSSRPEFTESLVHHWMK